MSVVQFMIRKYSKNKQKIFGLSSYPSNWDLDHPLLIAKIMAEGTARLAYSFEKLVFVINTKSTSTSTCRKNIDRYY